MSECRNSEIDQIKGLLIVLVVLGHALQYASGYNYLQNGYYFENPIFLVIYSFHMPLFALISGFLFDRTNKRGFTEVLVRKFKGIFLPLSIFCAILFIMELDSMESPLILLIRYFKSLVGWPLWFLSTVLIDSMIIAALSRLSTNKSINEIVMWLVFVISFFIPDEYIISIHKFIYPFFLIGYLMSSRGMVFYMPYKNSSTSAMIEIGIWGALSVVMLTCFDKRHLVYVTGFYIVENIDVLWYDIYRMIVAIVMSRFFCLLVHQLVSGREIRWLTLLGRNTLGIYCFQTILYRCVPFVVCHINISSSVIVPIICSIIVLSISVVFTLSCDKYIPCIIGKWEVKSS